MDEVWAKVQEVQKELAGEAPHPKQVAHLRRLSAVYNSVVGPDMLPGDVEHAIRAEADHQQMFKADPGYRALSLHGKYGPWKDALFQAWQQAGSPGTEVPRGELPDDPERARRVHGVLLAAVKLMAEVPLDVRQAWTQHVGRHVCRHHGYLVMLQDLGILVSLKSPASPQAGQPEVPDGLLPVDLSGGKAGKGYGLVMDLSPKLQTVLSDYLEVADLLASLTIPAPDTCQAWVDGYTTFALLVADMPSAPHCAGPYRLPWLWRSACLARMRFEGLRGLRSPDMGLAEFRSAFPDQNEWLDVLGQGHLSLAEFMGYLEYDGEPELLTMRLCLNFDAELRLYRPEWVFANQAWLQQRMRDKRVQLGFYPHLAHILQELREYWNCNPWTEAGGMPMGVLEGPNSVPVPGVPVPAPGAAAEPGEPVPGVHRRVPACGALTQPTRRIIGKAGQKTQALPPLPRDQRAMELAPAAAKNEVLVDAPPGQEQAAPGLALPLLQDQRAMELASAAAENEVLVDAPPGQEQAPGLAERRPREFLGTPGTGFWQTPPTPSHPEDWLRAVLPGQHRRKWEWGPEAGQLRPSRPSEPVHPATPSTVQEPSDPEPEGSDVEVVIEKDAGAGSGVALVAGKTEVAAPVGVAGVPGVALAANETVVAANPGAQIEGPSPRQLALLKRKAAEISAKEICSNRISGAQAYLY